MFPWNVVPWHRKEVYLGSSMQEFCKVRDLLSENLIRYDFRIVDQNAGGRSIGRRNPARGRLAYPFVNPEYNSMYYVYVNKQDYERAEYLLKK